MAATTLPTPAKLARCTSRGRRTKAKATSASRSCCREPPAQEESFSLPKGPLWGDTVSANESWFVRVGIVSVGEISPEGVPTGVLMAGLDLDGIERGARTELDR